ncbi:ketosteroid isomerase-like protein [Bradyrhizobium sp. USDA 326]
MSSEADAIVSAVIAKWCAGFAKLDAAALSSLYAKNAFFFGSNPKLYRGRAASLTISMGCRAGANPARPSPR